jgi:hypothetical protein
MKCSRKNDARQDGVRLVTVNKVGTTRWVVRSGLATEGGHASRVSLPSEAESWRREVGTHRWGVRWDLGRLFAGWAKRWHDRITILDGEEVSYAF